MSSFKIGDPFLGGAQDGNSTYHSLQVKLQHAGQYVPSQKPDEGLLTSYTWQKWLTNAPTTAGGMVTTAGGFEGVSARDQYHRNTSTPWDPFPPKCATSRLIMSCPLGRG